MSERDRTCPCCRGTGDLRAAGGCLMCGDTGMVAESVGDYSLPEIPYEIRRKPKTNREVMNRVIEILENRRSKNAANK
jgi:hypothetical protein